MRITIITGNSVINIIRRIDEINSLAKKCLHAERAFSRGFISPDILVIISRVSHKLKMKLRILPFIKIS